MARANLSIYNAAMANSQYSGMGTTLVAGVFDARRVILAHVGDSRCYLLRDGRLTQLTRDHSLLQEQIDAGLISPEQAKIATHKNLVTRAVGIEAEVLPELHVHDVLIGDVYLLCSDGLNDMVEDGDIESVMFGMQGNLTMAAEQLIQCANDNGGRDNVSVILVKIKQEFAQPRSWPVRLLNWFKK